MVKRLSGNTVWLSQKQMGDLFDKNVRTVSEHIGNVFKEGELDESSVIRNFQITAADGKSYDTQFYNLDVIISVGYRVKSKRGTQFRIWATQTLKEHLTRGYTLNRQRLEENAKLFVAYYGVPGAPGGKNCSCVCPVKAASFTDGFALRTSAIHAVVSLRERE
jgi:hypothetical protein